MLKNIDVVMMVVSLAMWAIFISRRSLFWIFWRNQYEENCRRFSLKIKRMGIIDIESPRRTLRHLVDRDKKVAQVVRQWTIDRPLDWVAQLLILGALLINLSIHLLDMTL